MNQKVIFVFLDGFGLGEPSNENPLYTIGIPSLEGVLGTRLYLGSGSRLESGIFFRGIDARLDVDGLPQSATGQTALFTGKNAPAILGCHFPAFPGDSLIAIIREFSILKRITQRGFRATFANAYSDHYFENAAMQHRTHSVTTHCMLAAELRFRTIADLVNGKAVYWDITRRYLRENIDPSIREIDPAIAGAHLAALSASHEFVLYECFKPDLVGHTTSFDDAQNLLEVLDGFFAGVLGAIDSTTNLIVCSDHGNIENLSVGSHTANPVPLIVIGPLAERFAQVERIDQIAEIIVNAIQ